MNYRQDVIAQLHDLIAALDRRIPQVARSGEASIVRAAAALREEACRRIVELDRGTDAEQPAYVRR